MPRPAGPAYSHPIMSQTPSTLTPRKPASRRGLRLLVSAAFIIASAAGWYVYDNRAPGCDSLASHGATLVNERYCVVPNDLVIKHPWDWKQLPANLVVHGDLDIEGTFIEALPEGLVVDGDIRLYKTDVAVLPVETWAGGGLTQYSGMYAAIPDDQLAAWHARRESNPARPADAP